MPESTPPLQQLETGTVPESAVMSLTRQIGAIFDRALENGVGVTHESNLSNRDGWEGTKIVVARLGIKASEFHYHQPHGGVITALPLPLTRIEIRAQGIGTVDLTVRRGGSFHLTVISSFLDQTYPDLENAPSVPPGVIEVVTHLGDKLNPHSSRR